MRFLQSTIFWAVIGVALVGAMVWQYRLRAGAIPNASPASLQPGKSTRDTALQKERVIAEGRVVAYPGAQVILSAEIPGLIEKLSVNEKDPVTNGEIIAEIKVNDLRALLAETKARLTEIDAELRLAKTDLSRQDNLRSNGTVSQQEFDRAQRDFDLLSARRATADTTILRIETTIDKATIRSPIAGIVLSRLANPGEMAETGSRLITVADTNRVRVEAELDEFDVGNVYVGQPAVITAEGYPGTSWAGTVEEIPDAVTEKNLKPMDPSRPTDARVLRVKIALKNPTALKLGQRVEIEMIKR